MNKNKKINFRYNLKEYFNLMSNYKGSLIFLFLLVFLTEILFIADKFLYKRIIDDGGKFLLGNLEKNVFLEVLIVIGVIFILIVIFRSIGKMFTAYLLAKLEPKVIKKLKEKYFKHILSLDYDFHTTHKTGSLISRLGRGAGAIENITDLIFFQISPLILQLIMVSVSIYFFTKTSTIVLIIITFTFILYSLSIQNIQKRSRVGWNKSKDIETGFVSDVFTNIDSIKFYGKEKKIFKKYSYLIENTRKKSFKFWNYFSKLDFGQTLILGIGVFFLMYFPLMDFLNKEISIGTIVFIYSLYGNVAGNLFGFVWGIRNFYNSMADIQDLFEYGKIKNKIKDSKNAKKLIVKEGKIEFKNVTFKYGKEPLFQKFNLKINPKEKIAFVGHSGCGKTTLVRLLNRFYDVDGGEILIDGIDIREFKQESLREETGIVPQECILFDDTIYNNIKFSNPEATKKEVMKAIKFAQLENVIKNFPKKENTIVGERGVKLSGGEKQRVSIARAILANKKILILDEATSSLDSKTEYEIQKGLKKLLKNKTSLIIAHRLSTIMNADRIVIMKKGKIIGQGKHADLIKRNNEYKKLWDLQRKIL